MICIYRYRYIYIYIYMPRHALTPDRCLLADTPSATSIVCGCFPDALYIQDGKPEKEIICFPL